MLTPHQISQAILDADIPTIKQAIKENSLNKNCRFEFKKLFHSAKEATVWHLAVVNAERKHIALLQALLEKYIDPSDTVTLNTPDEDGLTPLQLNLSHSSLLDDENLQKISSDRSTKGRFFNTLYQQLRNQCNFFYHRDKHEKLKEEPTSLLPTSIKTDHTLFHLKND